VYTFSPQLLNNFDELKNFFNGEKEVQKLKQFSILPSKNELYYNRWQVVWICITHPFKLILSVFIRTLSLLCFSSRLSKTMHIYALHLEREFDHVWTQFQYGKRLLVPSFNDYQLSSSDIYTLPPIRRENLLLPLLRENLYYKLKKVNFDRIGCGLCHGGVYWFNYLYLKAQKETSLEGKNLLIAVAKQFELGQPKQAALLQSLYGLAEDLLDVESEHKEDIQDLPPGIYYVQIGKNHAVSYIKTETEEFLWNPSKGLISIEKTQEAFEEKNIRAFLFTLKEKEAALMLG